MYGRGCVGSKCVAMATPLNNRTVSNVSSEALLNNMSVRENNMYKNNLLAGNNISAANTMPRYNVNLPKVKRLFTARKRKSLNKRVTRRWPRKPSLGQ